jgi:hypothetical protein
MFAAFIAALFFTVALIVTNGYFLMGSVPLLTLKHDTPLDGRFVRGFYDTYFLAAICTASPAAVSFALAGRSVFAVGTACLAALAVVLRLTLLPKMDQLRVRIQAHDNEAGAISEFRKLHITAILINLGQLVVIVWSLIALSMQMKAA